MKTNVRTYFYDGHNNFSWKINWNRKINDFKIVCARRPHSIISHQGPSYIRAGPEWGCRFLACPAFLYAERYMSEAGLHTEAQRTQERCVLEILWWRHVFPWILAIELCVPLLLSVSSGSPNRICSLRWVIGFTRPAPLWIDLLCLLSRAALRAIASFRLVWLAGGFVS